MSLFFLNLRKLFDPVSSDSRSQIIDSGLHKLVVQLGLNLDCVQEVMFLVLGSVELVAKHGPKLVCSITNDLATAAVDLLASLLTLLKPAHLSASKFLHDVINCLLLLLPLLEPLTDRVVRNL